MGDVADYYLDLACDDAYDDSGYESTVKCRYCGRGGFVWRTLDGKWRLHTVKTERLHICTAYKKPVDTPPPSMPY